MGFNSGLKGLKALGNLIALNNFMILKKLDFLRKQSFPSLKRYLSICIRKLNDTKFYIFLTVRLRIILVSDQFDAQFPLLYVYLNPLHVSSNSVLIFRSCDYTRSCINTIILLEMSTDLLETCRGFK